MSGQDSPEGYDGEAIDREIEERLLAVPAYFLEELIERGLDAEAPHLIHLARPDGREQLPAFQFDVLGQPYAAVLQVNELLEADIDPWGATDWWVSGHTSIRRRPEELLGTTAQSHLVQLVRDQLENDGF